MRDNFFKFVTLAVSVVVAIGVSESALRLLGSVPFREPPAAELAEAPRILLHRPSAIDGLAYELAPNVRKRAVGTVVETNGIGLRDDEPREHARRIVVLGDSYTFGFGVAMEDTYPARLERLLDRTTSEGGTPWDVMNFGVGGYSTRDEALVFEHKALDWDPEVVVLGYVLNDPEIDPIQPLQAYFGRTMWWQHSALLRLAARAKLDRDIRRQGDGDYLRYLHRNRRKWRSVADAMERIGDLASERGIPLVIVVFPLTPLTTWTGYPYLDLHAQVAAEASRHGMEVVDLHVAFARHAPLALRVSETDRHPNPAAHALAAEVIRDRLAKMGLVSP